MTKQHFKAIADILAEAQPVLADGNDLTIWRALVREFANMCETFNPHFDRERFFKACGYVVR